MDLKEAQKVVSDYGGFLEWLYFRLKPVFWNKIPESLLPYSIQHIDDALNTVARHYHDKGDKKMVNNIQESQILLVSFVDDKEAILNSVKMLSDKKWFDGMMGLIKDFWQLYGEPKHISGLFNNPPIGKVDLENQDLSTDRKIVDIYTTFLKYAHMRLFFIFSQKIPESLLPFPKIYILKALETQANDHDLVDNNENAELFTYGKTILEDYVEDEVAMAELIKNFTNIETRNSIIADIKNPHK